MAPAKDLEVFRQHVLALNADLLLEDQLARQLTELYRQALER